MILNRVKRPDYITIDRYIRPDKQRNGLKFRFRDYLYILVCALILAGFIHKVTTSLHFPSVQTAQATVLVKSEKIVKVVVKDERIQKLQSFLESKHSPFAYLSSYIITVSDENGIDYTLLASISGKESGYGVSARCYNAWGLGGRDFMCFSSWDESILFAAKLLGNHYRYSMAKGIQQKYCPDYECASDWTDFVVNASKEILAFK